MLTRRRFLFAASMLTLGMVAGRRAVAAEPTTGESWFMPDEGAPHKRTWMAFGASRKIWGQKLLPEVRRNLAAVANAIARFEPVSMLIRKEEADLARQLVGSKVELVTASLDDIWIRDTGPVFVQTKQGEHAAIDFHFNGWGKKQTHSHDAKVAGFVAQRAGVKVLVTKLVLEGGAIEVDGAGTAILAESCILNSNRNPGLTKPACEAQLKALLGLQKIIWLPGIKGRDITDGHVDFYARFTQPGVVVAGFDPDPASFDHAVTKQHLEILKAESDARGRRLTVHVMESPQTVRAQFKSKDFAAGYIGFYVCNRAVIMQHYGDSRADSAAQETLKKLFPDREIVPVKVDGIAAGGGTVHCVTQQEPAGAVE